MLKIKSVAIWHSLRNQSDDLEFNLIILFYVLNSMTSYDIESRVNSLDMVLYNLWVHIAQASANFLNKSFWEIL
ncbi:hypothetical protein BpHYR1_010408 [Brachionus plicatilis]|uniref:Uncharacterized protein n=1 Tax=Brachionus plicatilis TaxID=10195 RepID=A0A3M7T128_BRAPC|nr:hypothetical protein BpHYR1_010408 [Brachionus plicatilis]